MWCEGKCSLERLPIKYGTDVLCTCLVWWLFVFGPVEPAIIAIKVKLEVDAVKWNAAVSSFWRSRPPAAGCCTTYFVRACFVYATYCKWVVSPRVIKQWRRVGADPRGYGQAVAPFGTVIADDYFNPYAWKGTKRRRREKWRDCVCKQGGPRANKIRAA